MAECSNSPHGSRRRVLSRRGPCRPNRCGVVLPINQQVSRCVSQRMLPGRSRRRHGERVSHLRRCGTLRTLRDPALRIPSQGSAHRPREDGCPAHFDFRHDERAKAGPAELRPPLESSVVPEHALAVRARPSGRHGMAPALAVLHQLGRARGPRLVRGTRWRRACVGLPIAGAPHLAGHCRQHTLLCGAGLHNGGRPPGSPAPKRSPPRPLPPMYLRPPRRSSLRLPRMRLEPRPHQSAK